MKVYLNYDGDHFFASRWYAGKREITDDDLLTFIRQYQNTSVTDIVLDVAGAVSSTESKVFQSVYDKFALKEENGQPVDYTDCFIALMQSVKDRGIDPYAVWFREIRRCGMTPWAGFRMNDCHNFVDSFNAPCKPAIIEQHPEWWICTGKKPTGYFEKCLNYLLPEVQQYMLSFIEEQLTRYDVDGIELDFAREPYCFPAGREDDGRKAMLCFLRKVRELVNAVGKKKGKDLKIQMLCQANPLTAYKCGFDIAAIAKEKLVDGIFPAARWHTINLDIPIGLWKELVGEDIELGGVPQYLITPYIGWRLISADVDMAYAQAAAYVSMGANTVYLYNLYDYEAQPTEDGLLNVNSADYHWREIVREIGHTENMANWTRRCPVTFDDFKSLYEHFVFSLPLTISAGETEACRIVTGKIEKGQKTYLNLSTAEPVNPEDLEVYVNDRLATYCPQSKEDPYMIKKNPLTFAFDATADATVDTAVVTQIIAKVPCTVEYMEVLICPKDE